MSNHSWHLAVLFALAAFVWSTPRATAGLETVYESSTYGYRVALPADWTKIPENEFRALDGRINASPSTVIYDVGFQVSGGARWTNATVQIIPYGTPAEPTRSDVRKAIMSITTAKVNINNAGLTTEARGMLESPPTIKNFEFDRSHLTYSMEVLEMVKGVGLTHTRCYGFAGHSIIVQINCCSPESEYKLRLPQFEQIARSFAFEPGQEFQDQTSDYGWLWNGVGDAGFRGAVLGLILSLAYMIGRARRKKRAAVQVDANHADTIEKCDECGAAMPPGEQAYTHENRILCKRCWELANGRLVV